MAKKPSRGAGAPEAESPASGGYERRRDPRLDKVHTRTPASELSFVQLMRGNPRDMFPDSAWESALKVLAETANVSKAAEASGIARTYIYFRRKNDDDFAQAFDEAREAGIVALETAAMERAIEGVEEPVFYQGTEVARVRKMSDQLLMFLLQGNDSRYKRKQEITGAGGSPLNAPGAAFAALGDDELDTLIQQQQRELSKSVE